MASDPEHLMTALSAESGQIARELFQRLDAQLSEKDITAVSTALAKLAFASVWIAAAEMAAQLDEQDALRVNLRFEIAESDTWAEEYGDAGGGT
jgi:hypothetical protein